MVYPDLHKRDVYINMTPEEQAAAAAAEAQKATEAEATFETSIASLSDEEKEAKRTERRAAHSQPDYKAIAETERVAREKAENALADTRFKDSERKRKEREARIAAGESAEDIDRENAEKPLTASQLDERLAHERETTEKRLTESRARELAVSLTDSTEEAEAVLETYKNRSFPSHLSLDQKLEEAFYIVNGRSIIGKSRELARALKGKQGVNNNSASSHRDASGQAGDPSLSSQGHTDLIKQGFAYSETAKRYEKKLQNGGLMVKDLKTGKNVFLPKK